jgi:hypothetical protein
MIRLGACANRLPSNWAVLTPDVASNKRRAGPAVLETNMELTSMEWKQSVSSSRIMTTYSHIFNRTRSSSVGEHEREANFTQPDIRVGPPNRPKKGGLSADFREKP